MAGRTQPQNCIVLPSGWEIPEAVIPECLHMQIQDGQKQAMKLLHVFEQ